MKRWIGLAACMLPLASVAELVVPIASVDEYVNIRMVPDPKSEIVGRLFQGESAEIVASTLEWHEIRIAGGATGFISTAWTLVVEQIPAVGDVKDSVSSTPTAAADSTGEEKTNVSELTLEEALYALANLEPVTFSYRQAENERHVGFAAENAPELIASTENEGLKPLEIVAVLTRIVKLQQHQIAELESRLQSND